VEYSDFEGEIPRLVKIHENLKIIVNENGHIFILNRSSNKCYFFYKNASEKYELYKFVFSEI
jgi:hypothetical protein